MSWLSEALGRCVLQPDDLGYLLARGAREERIAELGIVSWDPSACEPRTGDADWCRLGSEGAASHAFGMIAIPLRSARGIIIGVDFRTTWRAQKVVLRHMLPEAAWNPTFIGLTSSATERIWAGCDVWLAEGFFDVCALEWAAGSAAVVFGCGHAAVSQQQVKLLVRLLPPEARVLVIFDNDPVGRRGATGGVNPTTGKYHRGAVDWLSTAGLLVSDAGLYPAKDPGVLWDRGGRAEVVRVFGSHANIHQAG